MTEDTKTARPPGGASLAVQGAALLLGLIAFLTTVRLGPLTGSLVALLVSVVVAFAGLPLALWTARLHPALKHTYNAHFLVIVPGLLMARVAGILDLYFDTAQQSLLVGLLIGVMSGAVSVSVASIAAPLGKTTSAQRSFALLGALGALAATNAQAGFHPAILLFAIAAAFCVRTDGPEPRALTNNKQGVLGVLAYVGVNAVIVIPAGVVLGAVIMAVWRYSADGEPLLEPIGSGVGEAIMRIAGGAIVGLAAMGAAFVWRQHTGSRLTRSLAAAALVLALGLTVGGPAPTAAPSQFIAILLALAATIPLGELPRRERWPGALMAAFAFAVAGMNIVFPDGAAGPRVHWVLFAAEGLVLGGVGCGVYFGAGAIAARRQGASLAQTHSQIGAEP